MNKLLLKFFVGLCFLITTGMAYAEDGTTVGVEAGQTENTDPENNEQTEETTQIRIATTAYNSARFSPVVTDLNDTIAAIRSVVTNTINQTKAIADLQATKQTRPADDYTDETNTENCPKFRQCLLVEDNNNTPHWYVIKDPMRDLLMPMKKLNWATNAKGSQDGDKWIYYNAYYHGDSAWRKTYVDGSTSTYNRFYNSCKSKSGHAYTTDTIYAEPCRDTNTFGNFHTLADGEWAVVYEGDEAAGLFRDTSNPDNVGVIYGTSKCTNVAGTYAHPLSELDATKQQNWSVLPNPVGQADKEGFERSTYKQCWCQMTGVGLDGEFTPVRDSSRAPWVFNGTYGSAANCAYYCALGCAHYVRDRASFRSAVLGFAAN